MCCLGFAFVTKYREKLSSLPPSSCGAIRAKGHPAFARSGRFCGHIMYVDFCRNIRYTIHIATFYRPKNLLLWAIGTAIPLALFLFMKSMWCTRHICASSMLDASASLPLSTAAYRPPAPTSVNLRPLPQSKCYKTLVFYFQLIFLSSFTLSIICFGSQP